jgi:hypothetical protein
LRRSATSTAEPPPAEPLPPLELERLEERARAARALIRAGSVDPIDALALVVWPPPELERLETREQCRALVALAARLSRHRSASLCEALRR